MREDSLVSVVIPVYNGARYLPQAIDSALGQTYPHCEVIVVNDGSEDGGETRKAALAYGDRIRYIEKENGGVASALNCGIQRMNGRYFCWLSHDDLFLPDKVECQMKAIQMSGNAETVCVGNYQLFRDEDDGSVPTAFQRYFPRDLLERPLFLLLWGELHFSSLLFCRDHFDRIGLFDESLLTAQDNEFMFRLMPGQQMAFSEAAVSRVRLHPGSGTSCFRDQVDKENRRLFLSALFRLSAADIRAIAPEADMVYHKIGGIIKSMGGNEELYILERWMEEKGSANVKNERHPLHAAKPIAIFGAGEYGLRLKYELNRNQIAAFCFLDNSPDKAGTQVDGIPCYPVSYLDSHRECTVIIAQKYYLPALKQLREIGYTRIMLKQEADALLLRKYEKRKNGGTGIYEMEQQGP